MPYCRKPIAFLEPEGEFQVRTLKQGETLLGYAFETINVVNIPAYSGKPINLQSAA